ncbi:hypothetical protein A2943_02335 [Candidatus Adlerbacteria bacterium RIFCSPLOWO2_01_FULL_51_16]|uniref:Haloacid dehalogenase n=1 Tax=Candidatus Adlerbacteria bacterium RIFCSPLOWO2_01_FULL_51_16 TaxID=1797243 RepID=A0A1F4XGJ5_9BACT|nr:MAG: hypothetical protein A2943_02335 [Candidatus Adlerbacteria bacterium RIFCSPLOWO2_01_FULL_51_16]
MVKGIIFDLDMCILDTHTLSGPFFEPVLNAFRNSELSDDLKNKIDTQLWTTSLEDTIEMFSVPGSIAEKIRQAYRQIDVPDGIKSFGDEECIADLPATKILVTTGYRKFQQGKIDQLNISHLFDTVIIDALDNRFERKGKEVIFKELLQKYNWQASEVLVVGDNPLSELGAAKRLGIKAVQTLRPTIQRWPEADHHVRSLCELKSFI